MVRCGKKFLCPMTSHTPPGNGKPHCAECPMVRAVPRPFSASIDSAQSGKCGCRNFISLSLMIFLVESVTMQAGAAILWTDNIQTNASAWGFDGLGIEHPIGATVAPDDSNGANLSRVADPLGSGFAMRHFATFDAGGSRSQAGIYGDVNSIFGNQAKKPEGIWVAQEWYFPKAISAGGDAYCWINLWDWHSIDADRGNRWHTSPGLMLARDGSMKVGWEWGGPAGSINPGSELSGIAMPVGRWFDIEMHYVWSGAPTATLTLWIDGQKALEQNGVQTRAASHQIAETYMKFYGSSQGRGPWVPTPSLKYTRNVRIANARIWQSAPVFFTEDKSVRTNKTRIKLTGMGKSVYIAIDQQRIMSVAIFSLDGRRIRQLTAAELFPAKGPDPALLGGSFAKGIVLVHALGPGVEEIKAVPCF
jgi:hypothetical protein